MTPSAAGWRTARLDEVAAWGSGGTPRAGSGQFYGGEIPWAVIGDLNDGVVSSTSRSITDAGLANSSAKWVPPGAVLIAMYGSIGKLGVAGKPLTTNQAIAFAVPDSQLDASFLFYYLMSQRTQLDKAGKGATQRNISQTILRSWPIAMPSSLSEQRRIVGILEDHLSRLDSASAAAVSASQRLAVMERSASDGAFPGSGPQVALGDLVTGLEAGRSFGGSRGPAAADEWGIIKVSAMTWGEFRPEENKAVEEARANAQYEVREGDLLVSRANTSEYVGASVLVGRVRPRLLLSDKSLRLRPRDGVSTEWLWRALQSPSSRRQITAKATGTKDSMRNISQASLRGVLLPAHDTDAQRRALESYRQVLEARQALKVAVESSLQREGNLRRAVLAAAFSGRLTGRSTDAEVIEELSHV